MNPEAEVELKRIAKKDLPELNEDDKAFLRARQSYLSKEQKEKFATVLKEKNQVNDAVGNDSLDNETLKEMCAERGIKVSPKANHRTLVKMLRDYDEKSDHPALQEVNQPE